ncbi:MAG: hypothetical protein P8Z00_08800 [Anaerolineales bacterium]|jgi:hypothetical protein
MKKPIYRKPPKEHPNCWEVLNCHPEVYNRCLAYPDMGRECWKVTGTKCNAGALEKSSLPEKIMYCRCECAYYKKYIAKEYLKWEMAKSSEEAA